MTIRILFIALLHNIINLSLIVSYLFAAFDVVISSTVSMTA